MPNTINHLSITPSKNKSGHHLYSEQVLPLPLAEIFPFYADAANLEAITPPHLKFKITSPQPIKMAKGALIDYSLRLYGLPFKWRSEISEWNPPYNFTDQQLVGPYQYWIHQHLFEETPEGSTKVIDSVEFKAPFHFISKHLVIADIHKIFAHREKTLNQLFAPNN